MPLRCVRTLAGGRLGRRRSLLRVWSEAAYRRGEGARSGSEGGRNGRDLCATGAYGEMPDWVRIVGLFFARRAGYYTPARDKSRDSTRSNGCRARRVTLSQLRHAAHGFVAFSPPPAIRKGSSCGIFSSRSGRAPAAPPPRNATSACHTTDAARLLGRPVAPPTSRPLGHSSVVLSACGCRTSFGWGGSQSCVAAPACYFRPEEGYKNRIAWYTPKPGCRRPANLGKRQRRKSKGDGPRGQDG
jgi:hypothetical protein